MEYKNDNRTPRDRIDESFFARLPIDRCRENDSDSYELDDMNEGRSNGGREYTEAFRTIGSDKKCGCKDDAGPDMPVPATGRFKLSLAMVYSPEQDFCELYDEEYGWHRGTVFKELDFPFERSSCRPCSCDGRNR